MSHPRAVEVTRQVGLSTHQLLLQAAKDGKRIRFIGDNLNFMVGVKEETRSNHKHMVHMFGSAALISDHYFLDKPAVSEIPLAELRIDHVMVSAEEYAVIKQKLYCTDGKHNQQIYATSPVCKSGYKENHTERRQ